MGGTLLTERTSVAMPDERQRLILEHLASSGRILASELARAFGISEDTARRDLRELAAAGLCRRVYGGALSLATISGTIVQRESENISRKAALGEAAAVLVDRAVSATGVVFIDAGSTNQAVAGALAKRRTAALTVVTNAPGVAAALLQPDEDAPGAIELVLIGGRVDRRLGGSFGAVALRDLAGVRIDMALLGTCAIDAEAGLTGFDPEEAAFKRHVAERAAALATTATDEKLGTAAPFAIVPAHLVNHLVVEADAPDGVVEALGALGVTVHRAGEEARA